MAFPQERAHASQRSDTLAPPAPSLALIVAVASNGTIGVNNALPWRLPDDLRHFKALTLGHAVIMGRRTWQSLGRPLPERQNIVVTRDRSFQASKASIAHTIDDAMAMVALPEPVFCIGGAELFARMLPLADCLYVTEIGRDFDGETRWTEPDWSQWRETARESRRLEGPDGFDYAFVTYERLV